MLLLFFFLCFTVAQCGQAARRHQLRARLRRTQGQGPGQPERGECFPTKRAQAPKIQMKEWRRSGSAVRGDKTSRFNGASSGEVNLFVASLGSCSAIDRRCLMWFTHAFAGGGDRG